MAAGMSRWMKDRQGYQTGSLCKIIRAITNNKEKYILQAGNGLIFLGNLFRPCFSISLKN
jgi:hypothetical protein